MTVSALTDSVAWASLSASERSTRSMIPPESLTHLASTASCGSRRKATTLVDVFDAVLASAGGATPSGRSALVAAPAK